MFKIVLLMLNIWIYNPYHNYTIQLELKCSYNNKTKKFDYHKFYVLKNKVMISIPNGVKDYQLWPKIL